MRMLKGKKVLVTGAAGFIGSHLVEALILAGARVTAMVRYNSWSSLGNLVFIPTDLRDLFTVVSGNIEDSDFVIHAMRDQEIVLHLAALIAIPYSYVAPRSYFRTNIEGTLNVLEAARRLGTARVVHTSTSEVYGTALRIPIDEEHPVHGQSPYSASKIGADKIAEAYFRSFETPVVTVRPFNTFGPRQSSRAFIPTIISQVLANDAIRLGSLIPQRDMTYVSDTVAGLALAATAPGVTGETINLGTGQYHSIGEFANRIMSIMGCSKPILHDTARDRPEQSEVMKLVSNNGKALRMLNWHPIVSLDDGLRQAISFVAENLALYSPNSYSF
jgi:NAD dependent epimerase/dehydratase